MKSLAKFATIYLNASIHDKNIELMKWLSRATKQLGVAEFTYVVGGAVRNFHIDHPIKDIDITIDVVRSGKNSEWLATKLQELIPTETKLVTNQYGVAILTIVGNWELNGHDLSKETIEIANTRKESYDPSIGGKGYKPHMVEPATIEEDAARREANFNTLLWRMIDLEDGPSTAKTIDITGKGLKDLEDRIIRTPSDPDKTFQDDPTRALRVLKFAAKYNMTISPEVKAAIGRNAHLVKAMPQNAIRDILVNDILNGPNPRKSLELLKELGLEKPLIEMMSGDVREDEPDKKAFSTSVGNSLNKLDHHLLLDILESGWPVKNKLSFLSSEEIQIVRDNLKSFEPETEAEYIENLLQPKIDQPHIFGLLNLQGRDRGKVVPIARKLLVQFPILMYGKLQEAVINKLQKEIRA